MDQPFTTTTRRFAMSDQEAFARLSGDWNPMHMDAVAARRTQASAPVVHGIHAMLWALDELARAGLPLDRLASIRAKFSRFVHLGRAVSIRIANHGAASARFDLVEDGMALMTVQLGFAARAGAAVDFTALPALPLGRAPLVPADMETQAGWLAPAEGADEAARAFPALCQAIGENRVVAIALLSTLVGMACPGLHSIFSGLSITLVEDLAARPTPAARPGLGFRTKSVRFGVVTVTVAGSGIAGEVNAATRAAPVVTPPPSMLRDRVTANEFGGIDALVVGGSRGLGAATASLIAAGGGRVTITYAQGAEDARALCDAIEADCGPGTARALALDVRAPLAPQLAKLEAAVNQLYYFATPQIFRQKRDLFDPALFRDFLEFYVERFHGICQSLADAPGARLAVFYPSSEAVTERPEGMTEYAMAKAAGEKLCEDLGRTGMKTLWHRIPRTTTDQTATIAAVHAEDPVDVMLPLIRSLLGMSVSPASGPGSP